MKSKRIEDIPADRKIPAHVSTRDIVSLERLPTERKSLSKTSKETLLEYTATTLPCPSDNGEKLLKLDATAMGQ